MQSICFLFACGCCGWSSLLGVSRLGVSRLCSSLWGCPGCDPHCCGVQAPAPAQAVTSSEGSHQSSTNGLEDDFTTDKMIAQIVFFFWCLYLLKLDYHPLSLKLAPVNFRNFFLFCSAQKDFSFHIVHQRKLCSMTCTQSCEPAAALPAFLLLAFLFDSLFMHREKYLI